MLLIREHGSTTGRGGRRGSLVIGGGLLTFPDCVPVAGGCLVQARAGRRAMMVLQVLLLYVNVLLEWFRGGLRG